VRRTGRLVLCSSSVPARKGFKQVPGPGRRGQ
jgi:hypothetical protein